MTEAQYLHNHRETILELRICILFEHRRSAVVRVEINQLKEVKPPFEIGTNRNHALTARIKNATRRAISYPIARDTNEIESVIRSAANNTNTGVKLEVTLKIVSVQRREKTIRKNSMRILYDT